MVTRREGDVVHGQVVARPDGVGQRNVVDSDVLCVLHGVVVRRQLVQTT